MTLRIGTSPSYLVRNSYSYCFRMKVPSDLQCAVRKKELRYSMRTGYLSEAKFKARVLAVGIQMLFRRLPEKAVMIDRSGAIVEIMTILNEDGLMIPGCRAHEIVTEYMNFKIDRMGPKEALEDVRQTRAHLVAQIHQMAM